MPPLKPYRVIFSQARETGTFEDRLNQLAEKGYRVICAFQEAMNGPCVIMELDTESEPVYSLTAKAQQFIVETPETE